MKLYSYVFSSASYRVRIALALKGVPYEYVPVDVMRGDQHEAEFQAQTGANSVPLLVDGDVSLSQSLAIIDYLDQRYPRPRLVPESGVLRARVLELSQLFACDIHPLTNRRVMLYLRDRLEVDGDARNEWYLHWMAEGLAVAERLFERAPATPFCFGNEATLADCCLIPQLANAYRFTRRYKFDFTLLPRAVVIYKHCMGLPAFIAAAPENQPDFQAQQ